MIRRVGVSREKGITSLLSDDNVYANYLGDEERKKNSFSRDSWTVTADIEAGTLTIQRPKIGKCPTVAESFTLQDGTLYLKTKAKTAEAKFIPGDLSVLLWEKYGIHEICFANPNRTYSARFRDDQTSPEEGSAFELVWTHTDGEVSTIERSREQHIKKTVRYGHLDQFVGNYWGLRVDEEVKSNVKIDKHPIDMRSAVKEFNDDNAQDLAVSNANFAVIFAMNPSYQLFNHLCILYTAEKDYQKIIEMLDKKLASDRLLNIRKFNLRDMAHDYWER